MKIDFKLSSMGLRRLVSALLILCAPLSVFAERQDLTQTLGLQKYGSGELRRFGFLIYEAQLWGDATNTTNPAQPPMALQLTYKREIAGKKIVEASVDQMRALGANQSQLDAWSVAMSRIFPDVKPGDQLIGIYRPGSATFIYNNREIGEVRDPDFARMFFGIWLDPRTSEPKLREKLLRSGAG
jgi:hypothetical protein